MTSRRSLLAAFLALPVASRLKPWPKANPANVRETWALDVGTWLIWQEAAMTIVISQFVDASILASRWTA